MSILWIKLGSAMMFLAVALGAFGAHAWKSKMSEYGLEIFKTATVYHLAHALALFVIAWLSTQTQDPKLNVAGYLLVAGIILFSGSLYALALTHIKILGAITPLGGLCFLIAWGLIFTIKF